MERKQTTDIEYDYQIGLGNEAQAILNSQALKDVLERIEQASIGQLLDQDDMDMRNEAWHQVKAIRKLKAELQRVVDNGKIAAQRKGAKK